MRTYVPTDRALIDLRDKRTIWLSVGSPIHLMSPTAPSMNGRAAASKPASSPQVHQGLLEQFTLSFGERPHPHVRRILWRG